MPTTLIAVTGLSPAVVTETLWALAHSPRPTLPERVEFITTAIGAEVIERQLFTPSPEWNGSTVWESLRQTLGCTPDQLIASPAQVITMSDGTRGRALELADIRTPAENQAAAEFLFSRVWNVVRDPAQRLIASVAGGRKTMGALLHSAVTLIGREDDLITHVLVDPPYETLPGFFFPAQPACPLLDGRGRAHEPGAARIQLAEVPFVPLRNRFKELDAMPGSFLHLRDTLAQRLRHDAERPVPIQLQHWQGRVIVDGVVKKCRPRPLAVLEFILRSAERNLTFEDRKESPFSIAAEAFVKWQTQHAGQMPAMDLKDFTARELTKDLSYLRSLLKHCAWQPATSGFLQAPFRRESS